MARLGRAQAFAPHVFKPFPINPLAVTVLDTIDRSYAVVMVQGRRRFGVHRIAKGRETTFLHPPPPKVTLYANKRASSNSR